MIIIIIYAVALSLCILWYRRRISDTIILGYWDLLTICAHGTWLGRGTGRLIIVIRCPVSWWLFSTVDLETKEKHVSPSAAVVDHTLIGLFSFKNGTRTMHFGRIVLLVRVHSDRRLQRSESNSRADARAFLLCYRKSTTRRACTKWMVPERVQSQGPFHPLSIRLSPVLLRVRVERFPSKPRSTNRTVYEMCVLLWLFYAQG